MIRTSVPTLTGAARTASAAKRITKRARKRRFMVYCDSKTYKKGLGGEEEERTK
jgi:hypothetical protein